MVYDKHIKCDYFTGSGVVSKTPCWLFAVLAMSSQTVSKSLRLRNGALSTSPIKMVLYASVYSNGVVVFDEPIYFDKGLYLIFASTLDNATIQYKPVY